MAWTPMASHFASSDPISCLDTLRVKDETICCTRVLSLILDIQPLCRL